MKNTTVNSEPGYPIEDYYVVASLSVSFCFITTVICTIILILILRIKSRLHTVHHLLICNTCIASIFYCNITTNNYVFLIFIQWETSDMSCRWRAYFTYVGIAGVMYSYLLQAISCFFFSAMSSKYRWLTTFKTHYILIGIQWLIVFLITSSNVIAKDITFSPNKLCLIPMKNTLHAICAIFAYYGIPLLIIIIIYIYIYCRVKQIKRCSTTFAKSIIGQKRDLELLRNIIILISIYLGGGLPSIVFFVTQTKYPYLVNLVTQSLTVAIAKLCIILLDKQIHQVIKSIMYQRIPVMPFNNARPTGTIMKNHKNVKQTNV
jgi:hypothetical protein